MPDTLLLVEMGLLLAVIGGIAGVIAGLLGVGGGIVLVPSFFYAFSALGYGGPQLMQVCLATSLATIIVTSVKSVRAHNRRGAVDWVILRGWAPWIAGGAVMEGAIDRILETLGGGAFIFNLGHGITPETPISHVEALVARIRRWDQARGCNGR